MKNFILSGGSKRSRKRSIFMRMLMGVGALATTYIIIPRVRKMAKDMMDKGLEGSDSLIQRGKNIIENIKHREKPAEDIIPYEITPVYDDEESEALSQLRQLQNTMGQLEEKIRNLQRH